MPLRLAPIDERHSQIVALLYGPVALFAIEPGSHTITGQQLLSAQRIGNSAAWEVATDTGKVRMLPYPAIQNETYSSLPSNLEISLERMLKFGLILHASRSVRYMSDRALSAGKIHRPILDVPLTLYLIRNWDQVCISFGPTCI